MKITIDVEGTLCVECGPNVAVDGEGCCAKCGATAYGSWLQTQLVEAAAEIQRMEALLRERAVRQRDGQLEMARTNAATLPFESVKEWKPCGTSGCDYCDAFAAARELRLAIVRPSA